jgi:hypothetical protein
MFRKVVGIALVMFLGVNFGLAEEIRAVITKVDGDKVTSAESKGKGEKGAEKTLPVDANVKVVTAKFNRETKKLEAGDAVEGGLKNEMFAKIGERGKIATVVTNADNTKIVEIRVFSFKKGK